jgi:hypothetical protein
MKIYFMGQKMKQSEFRNISNIFSTSIVDNSNAEILDLIFLNIVFIWQPVLNMVLFVYGIFTHVKLYLISFIVRFF